jgi:hypothetical protein
MHSRETVTRTSLVGWPRPGLRSAQAHRLKAIGYVALIRRLEGPSYLYETIHKDKRFTPQYVWKLTSCRGEGGDVWLAYIVARVPPRIYLHQF